MKRILYNLIFLVTFLSSLTQLSAQTLPPNQPEQDACTALQICGNFYTPYSYAGEGLVADLPTTPCYSTGESNSVWFRLEVNTAGTIVFSIVPNDTLDDYDFAVIDLTNGNCSSIQQSQVIRCNFNNNEQPNTYYNGGIVGLNSTSTTQFVMGGAYGQPFLQEITANAGDVYLIMINNFGHDDCFGSCPGSGFLLDFTGSTATFNQPPPPAFASVKSQCDYSDSVIVNLTENAFCSSIAPDGTDFYLTPSGTVASAVGIGCSGVNGYTEKVKLLFSSPLPNGDYYVHAQVGSDTNTLLGLCSSALQVPDSLQFHVGNDPIQMRTIDSPACQTLHLHLNSPIKCNTIAADGSDFEISGPSSVLIAGATGVNCTSAGYTQAVDVVLSQPIAVDGHYWLVAKLGNDGNVLDGDCGRSVLSGSRASFWVNSFNGLLSAGPDTTTCAFNLNLYSSNNGTPPSGGFQYNWTPTTGIQNPTDPNSPIDLHPGYQAYVLSTVDGKGCFLRDSVIIVLTPLVGDISPENENVCEDTKVPITASGGVSYKWSHNPDLSGTPGDLSCTTCPEPFASPESLGDHTYYVEITNNIGCTDTLSSLLHVVPRPSVVVKPQDTIINYGEGLTLYASGASFYTWTPAGYLDDAMGANPYATPIRNTDFVVVGSDKYGCTAMDTAHIKINFRAPVFIPNAFSPNGDGVNDVFKIEQLTFQKILVFRIYDRWGNLVFDTQDSKRGWDGTYNGKLAPQGTYNYLIELAYPDNYQKVYKGTITLIR